MRHNHHAALTALALAAQSATAQQATDQPAPAQQSADHQDNPKDTPAIRQAEPAVRVHLPGAGCSHAPPEARAALERARNARHNQQRITIAPGPRNAFDVQFSVSSQVAANPDFVAALELAAQTWEARISDDATVVMSVDFVAGEPFIAAASSNFFVATYDTWRNALINDADPDELAYKQALPTSPPTFDFGSFQTTPGPADQDTFATTAQSKSLFPLASLPPIPDGLDASIVFNTDFNFDNDPSDGLTPGSVDTVYVMIHELGHALGFVSGEGSGGAHTIWDYYRLPGEGQPDDPDTLADVTAATRILETGAPAALDTVGLFPAVLTSVPLSTGTGTGGDGRQASHWKDESLLGIPLVLGVMDPTYNPATIDTNNPLSKQDLLAFSLMGWNITVPTIPTSCPVDVNNDGVVDVEDLYAFTQNPSDINGDGNTNADDTRCLTNAIREGELQDMESGFPD